MLDLKGARASKPGGPLGVLCDFDSLITLREIADGLYQALPQPVSSPIR